VDAVVRTYAAGMVEQAPPWELFNRRKDPAESNDVSAQEGGVFEELKAVYLDWVDREVGGGPDPLRVEAAKCSAANNVKRRYEQWLATQKGQSQAMNPAARGQIDDRPAD